MASADFHFHPELFEYRATAMASLSAAGFEWLSHYNAVDLVHEEFGLEVCGIRREDDAVAMIPVLERAFPGWSVENLWHKDFGREPGWKFTITRDPEGEDDDRERVG